MSESAPIRFSDGLLGRTVLLGILPTAAVLAGVIVVGAYNRYQSLREGAEASLKSLAIQTSLNVDRGADDAVELAKDVAISQSAGMFGMRRLTTEVLRQLTEANPWALAVYVGYEPDADGKDDESLRGDLDRRTMDESGRFIPYWFRDPTKGGAIELKPLVDMDTSLYYDGVRRAFKANGTPAPMVTEPYFYDGDLIVEQSYPIVIDGKFVGIGAVDRSLASIRADALRFAEQHDVTVYIVSGRGRFVASSLPGDVPGGSNPLQTLEVAETDFAEIVGPLLRLETTAQLTQGLDPLTGEDTYFASAGVATGGWMVILTKPVSAVVGPIVRETIWIASLTTIALTAVVTLLVLLVSGFSKRIRHAVHAAGLVAKGDLSQEVHDCPRRDEAGVLLRTLAAMRNGLVAMVGRIKHAAVSLHTATTEVAAAGRQQEEAATEFESSSTEIAAAVHQISRTGEALVSTMKEVRSMTDEASSLAGHGRESLDGMRTSMRTLEEATGSIAEKLAAINEKAGGITAIVTTITKVADQTNLLSVNAAIEAEKAGEYGRGFLVVAREIRRLADQAAGATLDIEKMVAQMQSAVSAGVMEMDRFAEQVRSGVEEVDSIGSQMGRIIEHVTATSDRFAMLDSGVREQSAGAGQIDLAMGRLRERARQSAESVREFSQSAEALQKALGSLRGVIDQFKV
jgi:methyl-accepting chemotaxis protein